MVVNRAKSKKHRTPKGVPHFVLVDIYKHVTPIGVQMSIRVSQRKRTVADSRQVLQSSDPISHVSLCLSNTLLNTQTQRQTRCNRGRQRTTGTMNFAHLNILITELD